MKPAYLILAAAGVLAFAAWSKSRATATRRTGQFKPAAGSYAFDDPAAWWN